MKTIISNMIFASLIFFTCSCGNKERTNSGNTTDSTLTKIAEVVEIKPTDAQFIITKDGIGKIKTIGSLPKVFQQSPYSVKKEVREFAQEGETWTVNVRVIYKVKDIIAEISEKSVEVFSSDFVTEKKIGVKSKASEFVQKYPNYKIRYSYIDRNFVMETSEFPSMQFILNYDCCNRSDEYLSSTDMIILKPADLKAEAHITSIRL